MDRCQTLKEQGLADKKTVKDMKDKAISAVTKVVDAMMEGIVKREMSGLEIDTSVIEKTSMYHVGLGRK